MKSCGPFSNYIQGLKSAILAIFQTGLGWPCTVSAALKNPSQVWYTYFTLFQVKVKIRHALKTFVKMNLIHLNGWITDVIISTIKMKYRLIMPRKYVLKYSKRLDLAREGYMNRKTLRILPRFTNWPINFLRNYHFLRLRKVSL